MFHRATRCGWLSGCLVVCTAAAAAAQSPGLPTTEGPSTWKLPPGLFQAPASGQPAGRGTYTPITTAERVGWIVDGTVGLKSLGVGVIAGAWDTGINTPEEWGRTFSGFGKRYAEREADVAISSSIEAGVGAIWGEDPRYIPSQRRGVWPRARYAIKTAFVAPRHDERLHPAWGRLAGNVLNNVIENSWLPPSVTTGRQTTVRSVQGYAGRLIGNLWAEFWPDLQKRTPGFRGKRP